MELVKVPTADGDIHDDWKVIADVAKIVNALGDLRVTPSAVRNKLTLNATGATLELMLGGAAAAAAPADFSLYDASTTTDGVTILRVGVKFGCVTSYRSASGLAPWPSNYTADNHYKYEFAINAFGAVWLQVTNDTTAPLNEVSAIILANGSTPPAPDGTTGIKPLGTWDVDTSVTPHKLVPGAGFGVNGIGNRQYEFIGGIHAWGPA